MGDGFSSSEVVVRPELYWLIAVFRVALLFVVRLSEDSAGSVHLRDSSNYCPCCLLGPVCFSSR